MRVTFVSIGWEQLAISQLSSILKEAGHDVRLAYSPYLFDDRLRLKIPWLARIFSGRPGLMQAIRRQKPDVLAFSVVSMDYQVMLGVAREAKTLFPGIKTVFGGVHVSATPERVIAKPEVDYIVIGEGDEALPRILRELEAGGPAGPIPNTWYKNSDGEVVKGPQIGFIQDLDALPIPDKVLWEDVLPFQDTYFTTTSRGCPYRCTFCFNNFFANLPDGPRGKYVRRRSVGHVMHELTVMKRRYQFQLVEFWDDIFTMDKVWLRAFLDRYQKEIALPYQIFTHVKFIDEEVGRWLGESGCRSAQIGVQSMDEDYKKTMTKRTERNTDIAKTLEILQKNGVEVRFDMIFGMPGDSLDAMEKARQFYVEHTPDNIECYWFNIFPGTEMMAKTHEMGLVTDEQLDRLNEGYGFDIMEFSNTHIAPEKFRSLKVYELIFRLLPRVSRPLRRWMTPQRVGSMPLGVLSLGAFLYEVFYGLFHQSIGLMMYARYYLYHIKRHILMALGRTPPSATRILDARPVPYMYQPTPAHACVSPEGETAASSS